MKKVGQKKVIYALQTTTQIQDIKIHFSLSLLFI